MVQEYITISNVNWYLYNDHSKHMTRDKTMCPPFTSKKGGFVSYGDINKGEIIDVGTVDNFSNSTIEKVLLVDCLKDNLLSIKKYQCNLLFF